MKIRMAREADFASDDAAEKAKASRVWWLTHESNTQAMHLYDRIADKSGFIQYRKLMQSN
jgi:ribosomal protein S18 acetylase RimI-like enzyme